MNLYVKKWDLLTCSKAVLWYVPSKNCILLYFNLWQSWLLVFWQTYRAWRVSVTECNPNFFVHRSASTCWQYRWFWLQYIFIPLQKRDIALFRFFFFFNNCFFSLAAPILVQSTDDLFLFLLFFFFFFSFARSAIEINRNLQASCLLELQH